MIDLISNVVYTKAIPKVIRLSLLQTEELFREKIVHAKGKTGFQNALVRDQLKALAQREYLHGSLYESTSKLDKLPKTMKTDEQIALMSEKDRIAYL